MSLATAIITPQAGNTFYIDSKDGRTKYESFFVHEFIPAMERKYRVGGSRARRAISGVSMGGFGKTINGNGRKFAYP